MLKNTSLGEVITIGAIAIVVILTLRLGADNRKLSEENGRLAEQSAELSHKNDGLAESLSTLSNEVQLMNKLVATESKRRAAAEMKSQKLQEEVKGALKDNQCAREPVPSDAVNGVRKAADSARSHKSKKPSRASKSSD
ncbi:DUF2570 domain-containing protein [Rouxiella sp. Mn2063]|uniref:DUF2570 domain-containing protein n=1 Tax=Rouxiella sp. Mn2063 TaxID=3395262 RepID=UPI003BDBA1DC